MGDAKPASQVFHLHRHRFVRHLGEEFHLEGAKLFLKTPKKLEIDTIVIDPDRLSAPFRYVRTYDRDTSMEEEICQENNRDNNGTIDLTPPPP